MIVIDASVLVDLLLGQPRAVDAVDEDVAEAPHEPLCAPDLIHLETLNTLRGYVSRGLVSDTRATKAALDLAQTRLAAYPHAPLALRVWELRHNLSAYDASYLALAELLDDSVLITADSGLAGAAARSLGESRVKLVA